MREALGSILHSRDLIEGATVLELFAGTGAMSFELLSRGAVRAVLVESDRRALKAIHRSAQSLGLADSVEIRRADGFENVPPGPFDLVFLDPPYAEVGRLGDVLARLELSEDAAVVIEHLTREPPEPPDPETGLACAATYKYGDTSLMLLKREPS